MTVPDIYVTPLFPMPIPRKGDGAKTLWIDVDGDLYWSTGIAKGDLILFEHPVTKLQMFVSYDDASESRITDGEAHERLASETCIPQILRNLFRKSSS